jgi:hypothetical protein
LIHRIRIAHWNSTANGYRWSKEQWRGVLLDSPKVFKDGDSRKLTGKQKINFFGGGRHNGFSCGEYLHVPIGKPIQDQEEGCSYRVRCQFQPGGKYRGSVIESVKVNNDQEGWFWEINVAGGA